jgi:hypothetical protein
MRYRLVLLTHGRDFEPLKRTLRSFWINVQPQPNEISVVYDGASIPSRLIDGLEQYFPQMSAKVAGDGQVGFCDATNAAWESGSAGDGDAPEYVFHLEHDFVFHRAIHLAYLANVLAAYPEMAQISLMRQPCNPLEEEAGGVVDFYGRETFEKADYVVTDDIRFHSEKHFPYLVHHHYFTTNPSLMRREFMAEHSWPNGPACEGVFGLELRNAGFCFGVWGDGEPWIEHIGKRNGKGY